MLEAPGKRKQQNRYYKISI